MEMEMEEKETTMKNSIECLLEGLLRNKQGDEGHVGFVPALVESAASPGEGVLLIRFSYQAARIARRNHRPRHSIGGSRIVDSASPELGGCRVPRISIFLMKLLIGYG